MHKCYLCDSLNTHTIDNKWFLLEGDKPVTKISSDELDNLQNDFVIICGSCMNDIEELSRDNTSLVKLDEWINK